MTDFINKDDLKVLLVEDDIEDALLIKEMLAASGELATSIKVAETISEAKTIINDGKFDIILTDLNLPDSNHLSTLSSLLEISANIPIIVLTGVSDQELGNTAISYGAQDYLVKGNFKKDQLVRSIVYALKRQSAEEELKSSEERFRKMAENIQDGMIILEDNIVAFVNDRMCEITGYSIEEIKEMTVFHLAAPEEAVRLKDSLEKWRASGNWPDILSFWIITKEGKRKFIRSSFSEVNNGKKLNFITSTDLTEVKVASKALQEREQFLSKLIDATPNSVLYLSLEGEIQEYNLAAEEMFGISNKNKQAGINIWDRIPKYNKRIVEAYLLSVIEEGSIYDGNTVFLDRNLKEFPATINAAVIKGSEDSHIGIVAIIRDISVELKAEETLKEAKRKAEESDNLKTAFLANISHEIRTPMNAIMGLTQILKEDTVDNEQKNEFIDIVHKNSQDLLQIINDIVDISLIETDQLKLNTEVFKIKPLISELNETFSIDLKSNLNLKTEIANNLSELNLETDKGKVKQILRNLISNAIKFSEQGTISLGYDLEGDSIKIWVSDNGIGIDKKHHGKLFNRFFKLSENGCFDKGGTGLGLSISQELAEKISGRITVQSEPGKGSKFTLILPYHDVEQDEVKNSLILNSHKLSNKTILIAEDDPNNFFFLETILKRSHANVIHAINGKEAIQKLSNGTKVDLVLMDISMPVMNGLDATLAIRNTGNNIPIIAVTAFAYPEDKRKCIKVGCTDYITKPVRNNDFIKKITQYL